jgi:hypothetical protein
VIPVPAPPKPIKSNIDDLPDQGKSAAMRAQILRCQIHPRVSLKLARRLKAFCAAKATTETAVTEAALAQYLDQTSDHTVLMRRLDAISRQLTRASRDNNMLAEAFATFVHIWYAYTPELPDEAKGRAQRQAARRFEVFVQRVAQRLGNGRPFLDDLVRDDLFAGKDLEQARKKVFAVTSGNDTDELISIEDEDIEPEDEGNFKASE